MRTCPQCGRTYADEYNFCLADGSLLTLVKDPNKTEVYSNRAVIPDSVPTVDARGKDKPPPTVKVPVPTTPEPAIPTIAAFTPAHIPPQTVEENRSIARILLGIAGGVLVVMIVIGLIAGVVIGIVESSRQQNTIAAANTTPTMTPAPKPTATPSITPTPVPTPDPTPTKPVVITNPTLDPNDLPQAKFPKIEGRYYLREYQGNGEVLTYLDVYDQSGPDCYNHDTADDIYFIIHLAHTEKNEWIGYVAWEYSSGSKDREIIYICEDWKGLCGKLPGLSWYFVATKGK